MFDLLGDGNFWAGLSGTLAAAAWGIPRGIEFVKKIVGGRKERENLGSKLVEQTVEIHQLRKEKIELERRLKDKDFELGLIQTAYRRLEKDYDRQFHNVERFSSLEDELAQLKERISLNGK